jgi:predicted nucleic acid-binding protein
MVLVDTSLWVTHLRKGHSDLVALLEEGKVSIHPFIIGELACGHLRNRSEILSLLGSLPVTVVAQYEEVMTFIDRHRLMGKGLGYVDVHLLAAAVLSYVPLWTEDKVLSSASRAIGMEFRPSVGSCAP